MITIDEITAAEKRVVDTKPCCTCHPHGEDGSCTPDCRPGCEFERTLVDIMRLARGLRDALEIIDACRERAEKAETERDEAHARIARSEARVAVLLAAFEALRLALWQTATALPDEKDATYQMARAALMQAATVMEDKP